MNPALIILIIIGLILFWFLSAKFFKAIGNIVYNVGNNAIEAMKEDTERINLDEESEQVNKPDND